MNWLKDPLFGNEYGTNWKGLFLVLVVGLFLLYSFPWANKEINGNKDKIEEIRNNGIVCVKPEKASERAWSCWSEEK